MTPRVLVVRALAHYWRSNLAVIAGVATAVAVLAGALLVGDSVRGSLRDLVAQRLGRADRAIVSNGLFREALAAEIAQDQRFVANYQAAAPMFIMRGAVSEQSGGRRAGRVQIYGVDDRFWALHGMPGRKGPSDRDAFVSRALAEDVGASTGSTILVRVEKPTDIPIESLHGQKEDPGRTIRLTVTTILDGYQLGEFSLQPQQGSVRAVFVPLRRLQQDLEQRNRINTVLVADRELHTDSTLAELVRQHARIEDFGLKLRTIASQHALALESDAGFIDKARVAAAEEAAIGAQMTVEPVLTYLANAIQSEHGATPYSLVAALDLRTIAPNVLPIDSAGLPPIVLNDWAARDLGVKAGDPIRLQYYTWREPGYLASENAAFRVVAVVPIAGAAADRDLAPVYPGITEADTLGDWDPPFPIDLKRVRPKDETYWKDYRTTPKAFVPFDAGRQLWGSPRYGDRTSIRLTPAGGQSLEDARVRFGQALKTRLASAAAGLTVTDVRAQSVVASKGSTDFGEYFVYFSFFLVVSALVLATLFFRLSVEQRAREVGLLRAVGYTTRRVRRLFTAEGLLLAIAGSAIGAAAAVAYGALMIHGLRTWWSGAVGTRALALHVDPVSLVAGAAGAIAAAVVCIWWTLRSLSRVSERGLLAGSLTQDGQPSRRSAEGAKADGARVPLFAAIGLVVTAAFLLGFAVRKTIDPAGAFFGAGAAILGAGLFGITAWLRRPPHSVEGKGWTALIRIGMRNASQRPGRSVLAIAVIASAAFIVISVDAFRRGRVDPADPKSGTGGYPLLVDLMLPLVHDPNGRDGREALGIADAGATIVPFRLLPGEDASCLNLYQPVNPRILGAPHAFVEAGRFTFQGSLAAADADRQNPWRLLERTQADGTIPVIGDANSITYVLHKSVGDQIVITHGARDVRLKLVAALSDSVLQGELIMSDANFVAAFPEQQGYRFLFVDTPVAAAGAIATAIERGASDFGADAVPTAQRLEEYHAVENTNISTFQTLGGLGLLVGTIGLAAVLLRNVLERRRELALLRAVGYRRGHLLAIVVAENAFLLACGVVLGAVAAGIAVAPAALERGARVPISASGLALLLAVFAAGLVSSIIATRAAFAAPLVTALRTE